MILWWFIIFLVLLFFEIITVNLVSIWFAIGAMAAIVCTLFTDFLPIQILSFVIVSIISLIITKPVVKKLRVRKIEPTNFDRVLDMDGVVTVDIVPNEIGEVKVDGKRWSAISSEKILVGNLVQIIKIDGVKLIVKKKEN